MAGSGTGGVRLGALCGPGRDPIGRAQNRRPGGACGGRARLWSRSRGDLHAAATGRSEPTSRAAGRAPDGGAVPSRTPRRRAQRLPKPACRTSRAARPGSEPRAAAPRTFDPRAGTQPRAGRPRRHPAGLRAASGCARVDFRGSWEGPRSSLGSARNGTPRAAGSHCSRSSKESRGSERRAWRPSSQNVATAVERRCCGDAASKRQGCPSKHSRPHSARWWGRWLLRLRSGTCSGSPTNRR